MKFKLLSRNLKKFGFLWQALNKFYGDNGFFLSSAIAFDILFSLIPFIMLLLALVGSYFYNNQEVISHIHAYFRDMAPALDPKIMKSLTNIIQSRHIVGVLGFLGLLWFSRWIFSSLQTAFNIVFRAEKRRGMLRGFIIDLLMILLTGTLLLVSMALSSAISALQSFREQNPMAMGPMVQWILKYALAFILSFGLFYSIYKIVPNKRIHSKSALQAALFAGLLWELAKHLFTWYVLHIARYSTLYGSLNALVLFVLWVYYSSSIVVLGAEFAYFLEEDRRRSVPIPIHSAE